MHPANCNRVPLAHRCVRCNPGYGDSNQAYEIYQEIERTGVTREEAEQSYLSRHGHSR